MMREKKDYPKYVCVYIYAFNFNMCVVNFSVEVIPKS